MRISNTDTATFVCLGLNATHGWASGLMHHTYLELCTLTHRLTAAYICDVPYHRGSS